jgi:hypothetical protein
MKLDWADDVQNSVIPVAPYILGDDAAFCFAWLQYRIWGRKFEPAKPVAEFDR